MKSAYELAMERLEKAAGPSKKLSDEQKARIADIESVCDAKIAETKLSYESRISGAASIGELEQVRAELADRIGSLEAERDRKKEEIWNEAQG